MGGAATVTPDASNGNFLMNSFTINEINEITPVIAVDVKISGGLTDRTGFDFRSEKGHVLLKKRF